MEWNRRDAIKAGVCAASLAGISTMAGPLASASEANPAPYFRERGYYITFMRVPLFTFETWKKTLDAVKADGGTMVILWMGGAFRSKKFPITWQYNAGHENVKHNFAGALIDYGHTLGLKVLLALTPYGYDGANQYALEHPELKAVTQDGNYTKAFGLDAWGFNLNPYRPEAERFMLEYTREMLAFYPNADGLLLEASDYAISFCKDCPETYYEREFAFVRTISDELWAKKPDAMVLVYPHYFSGKEVPGMKIKAAKERFDPRWSLFFTPHSAYLDPDLIRQAKSSVYWDPSPAFGRPALIQAAAEKAKAAGVSGFVPSYEPWNFRFSGPDMGDQFLVGTQSYPFGFGWRRPEEDPSQVLLMRLDRLAYREFSRDPDLPMARFREVVSRELFAGRASSALLDDLFFVEESFFLDRTWDSTAAIASPEYVKGKVELGQLGPVRLAEYRDRRKRIAEIAKRYDTSSDPAAKELAFIASWITTHWDASPSRAILEQHLR